MNDLQEYFQPQQARSFEHPILRWIDAAEGQGDFKLEIRRPKAMFGFKPATMHLHLQELAGNDVERPHKEKWDQSLDRALVKRGIRAISPQQEMVRLTLSLRDALEMAEIKFGDGFFNAVLIHYLRSSPFSKEDAITSLLKHVYRSEPEATSQSYSDCSEIIDAVIRERALDLTERLQYDLPGAEKILTRAMAQYLDERFSISNRKAMGFI